MMESIALFLVKSELISGIFGIDIENHLVNKFCFCLSIKNRQVFP